MQLCLLLGLAEISPMEAHRGPTGTTLSAVSLLLPMFQTSAERVSKQLIPFLSPCLAAFHNAIVIPEDKSTEVGVSFICSIFI